MRTKTRSTVKASPAPKAAVARKKSSAAKALANGSFDCADATFRLLSEEAIAARAYIIWQEQGCVEGCDEENWLQAEAELKNQTATR